ncbi:hypothetical protein ES703_109626 [subsurface metagenome]
MSLTNKDLRVITVLNLIRQILERDTPPELVIACYLACESSESGAHLLTHRNFNGMHDIPLTFDFIKFQTTHQVYPADAFTKIYISLLGDDRINPTPKQKGEE